MPEFSTYIHIYIHVYHTLCFIHYYLPSMRGNSKTNALWVNITWWAFHTKKYYDDQSMHHLDYKIYVCSYAYMYLICNHYTTSLYTPCNSLWEILLDIWTAENNLSPAVTSKFMILGRNFMYLNSESEIWIQMWINMG